MADNSKNVPSLVNQSIWLLIAKLLGFGFAFVLPLIVVRVLSKEEFGLYRQAFLVVMNAVAILPFGISMSAYYYLARDESKRAAAVLNILLVHFGVGLVSFLVLFLFPGLLGTVFGNSEMTRLAPLIGIAVWLWLFSVFLEHAAVANREPKNATAFIVFAQFSKTALMVGFVLWFGTVESIIWAAIIQAAIQTVILLLYLGSRFPSFWRAFDAGFFKEHLRYAAPFGFAGVLWTMQVDLHYYFVSNRFGEAAYAVYAVGCFQLPLVSMLAESVVSVLIPKMSELQLKNDTKEMIRVIVRAMEKLAFAYFPVYVFFFVTAETLITTLFTSRYLESVPIFLIFLTLLPFSVLISDPVVRAYENLGRFLLKVRIITFVVLVGGLVYGVNNFGLEGIIATVVTIRVLEMVFVEIVVFRSVGVTVLDLRRLDKVGKAGLVSIFGGIATFFFYGNAGPQLLGLARRLIIQNGGGETVTEFFAGVFLLGCCLAVFIPIYIAGSYLTGTLGKDEIEHVRNIFRDRFAKT